MARGGAHGRATFAREQQGSKLRLALTGPWVTAEVAGVDRALHELETGGAKDVLFDLSGIEILDTTGAWLLIRSQRALEEAGAKVGFEGLTEERQAIFNSVGKVKLPERPPVDHPFIGFVLQIGKATFNIADDAKDLIAFLGLTVIVFGRTVARPWRIRWTALVYHMQASGLNALPIVGLMAFLIGVVLAFQGADQLQRFGAEIFTVNLVGVAVLREMGILITAIIVAGRSGSAYTAQIGTMKVNEEVDAMKTLGLDPMEVLVMPRIMALVLVLPLLTFYADIMGLVGGAVMATSVLDISPRQFIVQLGDAITPWAFWVGMIKAPIFAFIIAMVGCFEGLKVTSSAESVGMRTTKSVVEAIFLVIVLDAVFSIFFTVVGV